MLAPKRKICLEGAVLVVLHFRHLRIALNSVEALRGVSINSWRLSPNQALHLSSMKAEHQTHRCCAVSLSSPQNLPYADSCLPTSARQLPRAVWWPHLERGRFTHSYRDSSLRPPPSSSSRAFASSEECPSISLPLPHDMWSCAAPCSLPT